MALTPSTMLPLGTPAPDFALPNAVDGTTVSLADFQKSPAREQISCCVDGRIINALPDLFTERRHPPIQIIHRLVPFHRPNRQTRALWSYRIHLYSVVGDPFNLLNGQNRLVLEQIGAQVFFEIRMVPSQPFQYH